MAVGAAGRRLALGPALGSADALAASGFLDSAIGSRQGYGAAPLSAVVTLGEATGQAAVAGEDRTGEATELAALCTLGQAQGDATPPPRARGVHLPGRPR